MQPYVSLLISDHKISGPIPRTRPPSAGAEHVELRLLQGHGGTRLGSGAKMLIEVHEQRACIVRRRPMARHHRPCSTGQPGAREPHKAGRDRKSTRLNSSHMSISYAVFCLKKKKKN